MAIKASCPSCQQEVKLINSFWEKGYRCKGCGNVYRITRDVVIGFTPSKKEPPAKYAHCPYCTQTVLVIEGACLLCKEPINMQASHTGVRRDSIYVSSNNNHVLPIRKTAIESTSQSSSIPLTQGTDRYYGTSHSQGMSNRHLIILGCCVVTIVVGMAIGFAVLRGQRKSEQEKVALRNLTQELDLLISQSTELSNAFRFDEASNCLNLIQDRILDHMNESLENKYWMAVASVKQKKQEYRNLLRKGYVVFEGNLVTKEQRDALLKKREVEQREAEKRRKAEAKRQREEEDRKRELARQAEIRRQEREQQAAAEKLKRVAYKMSHTFVQKKLKAPSAAKFPPYDSLDVSVTYDVKEGKFTVRAWVDAQNVFGVFLRTPYLCILWPSGGDYWRSDQTILN